MSDTLTEGLPESISLEDVSEFGDLIPAGVTTICRASKIEAKLSKQDKPMIELTWSVLDGEYEGLDQKQWFPLGITRGKNGKFYGRGVQELRKLCIDIGKPLGKVDFKLNPTLADAQATAKLLFERLKPTITPRVKLQTVSEKNQVKNDAGQYVDELDETGKPKMRVKTIVVGLPSAPVQQVAGDGGDTLADPLAGL